MNSKKLAYGLIAAGLTLVVVSVYTFVTKKNDIKSNAVMVVNREMNHGGTGLILSSAKDKSYILTNDHVCKAVKTGGLVITKSNKYQINSMIESKQSDLCLLSVLADLGTNTRVSSSGPKMYDAISVSGFPALMPNVVSIGHLSGRDIIPVLIGVQPCTKEDMRTNPLMCLFVGGLPIIKYYESVLTSATIMPGNSGSGVYNADRDLIGVVFAGQGDLGYSWTVPYEQVVNFLKNESVELPEELVDQSYAMSSNNVETKSVAKQLLEKCKTERPTDSKLEEVCDLVSKDMIWRK